MTNSTHNHSERRPSISTKAKLLTAGVAVVVLASGGLATANFALDHTKVNTYAVAGSVHEIVVKSDAGNVDLVPAAGQVAVRETQHYVTRKPKLERTLVNGVLTVDSHCGFIPLRCDADLRVTVPAGVRVVHVESDSGDVRVALAGRQARVRAHTDSGDVDVDAAARNLDASSDSGDIDVAVPSGDYAVDADSDSGDVEVSGVARNDHAPSSITARTDSGDVTVRAR